MPVKYVKAIYWATVYEAALTTRLCEDNLRELAIEAKSEDPPRENMSIYKSMESKKTLALVELGILCRGERMETSGNNVADCGPHSYSGHSQLCQYENPIFQYPFLDPTIPSYVRYPVDLTVEQAIPQTKLIIFLGAANSAELQLCLEQPNVIVLIFEPDVSTFNIFLEDIKLFKLNRSGVFCFLGDPYSFNPALQDMLQGDILRAGTPAFFLTDRIRENYASWANQVVTYIEVLHYRHAIYGISSQYRSRSMPFRQIVRDLTYDQQVHLYENINDLLLCPDVAVLRGKFHNYTAILVAAGPDLEGKLEFIRRNRDRAVIICVNNAIKPLAEAGISPHFVVINDMSIRSGEVFKNIPKMPETILVGYCLSDLGGAKFNQKYIFGEHCPKIFGTRRSLEAHGSVISAAFSLAELLGCNLCVIVGCQLASNNPWVLEYAKGTMNEDNRSKHGELINEYPQLYPQDTIFCETLYTTLNFKDAALWLAEVIRLSKIDCINTSKESILYGHGVRHELEPKLVDSPVSPVVASLILPRPRIRENVAVSEFIRDETGKWQTVYRSIEELRNESGEGFVTKGMEILAQFDQLNITFLVERYGSFNNRLFYTQVFEGDLETRSAGLQYYFEHVEQMSKGFLQQLFALDGVC